MTAAKKRPSGPSGPTQSPDDRRAAGRRQYTIWLDADSVERLETLRSTWEVRHAVDVIKRALEECARRATR